MPSTRAGLTIFPAQFYPLSWELFQKNIQNAIVPLFISPVFDFTHLASNYFRRQHHR
jgi:hypothetical protein